MARDLQEAIEEEEARELEEATDLEEQEQSKEYEDEEGENLAATTGTPASSSLEFVCSNCGKRSAVRHVYTTGVHCGRHMLVVDHEAKRTYPFGLARHKSTVRKKHLAESSSTTTKMPHAKTN